MGEHDGVERTVELLVNDYDAREKELRDAVMLPRHDALGHVLITTTAQKEDALDALLTFVRARAVRQREDEIITVLRRRRHDFVADMLLAVRDFADATDALMKEAP